MLRHGQHRPAVRRPLHRPRCVRRACRACPRRRHRGRGRHPVHAGSLDAQRGHQGRRAPRRAGDRDPQAADAARSRPEGPDLHERHDRSRRGRNDRPRAVDRLPSPRLRHLRAVLRPPSTRVRHQAGLRPVRAGDEERAPVGHLSGAASAGALRARSVEPREAGGVRPPPARVGQRRRAGAGRHPPRRRCPRGRHRAAGHGVPGQREGDAGRGRRARSASRPRSDREGRALRPQLDGVAGLGARRGRETRLRDAAQPKTANGRRCPPRPAAW